MESNQPPLYDMFAMAGPRRAGDDVRVIRLRADESLVKAITPARSKREGGTIALPPRRDRIAPGTAVRIEFGFGALSDEIVIRGDVTTVDLDAEDGTRHVVVAVVRAHAARLRYVLAVLDKRREPVVRRHARATYSQPIRWTHGTRSRETRMGDLSCGGAFIVSDDKPPIDTIVHLAFVLAPDINVDVEGRVAWHGIAGDRRGFGVEFRGLQPSIAATIRQAVRNRSD